MSTITTLLAAAGSASTGGSEYQASILDQSVVIFYILGVVALGLAAGKMMKKKSATGDSKDYFLAGGTLRWPMIGLALFATNISCVHLVSLAQTGFDDGLINGNFEWMAAFTLILLALFFAPFYIKSKVPTLPDFLEKRYNRPCRDMLSVLSIVSAVTIHIGFSFLTGGKIIENVFGIEFYTGIILIAAITALYTIVGGLLAVVLTEAIQTVILIAGACLITWFAYDKMGGWDVMTATLEKSGESDKLSMLQTSGDLPWYAVFLGYPVLGIWYWCADQTIVQRVLGAKDENHARVGPLFAGLIKILPVFIFVLPGVFCYVLYKNGGIDLAGITTDGKVDSVQVYGEMIKQLLPTGLVGLLIAALLAALMSTVSGALNSISTLAAFDIYKRFKPDTDDKKLVHIGRVSAGIALVLAIALIPLLLNYDSIFKGLNDIIAHIAAPVTCVFLLGVFWKKANAFSAQWTLIIGSLVGVSVFALGKLADWWPSIPGGFMMMAFYLFVFCVILQVSLTVISGTPVPESSAKLCWNHPLDPIRQPGWKGIGNYKFLSLLLLAIMAVLYYLFR